MILNDRVNALHNILKRSPYSEYLYRNATRIGFRFENGSVMLNINYSNGSINLENYDDGNLIEPELWVEVYERELIEFAENEKPFSKINISTSGLGQVLEPAVERIIQRILMPCNNGYPLCDRIELIYGGLFGFDDPEMIWKGKNNLYVLKYEKAFKGFDVYVTSGFTNPDIGKSDIKLEEGKVSGYGYELMILANINDTILVKEFVEWVKYIDVTGKHIYQGQYLEYSEGIIPGTNLGGFIVLSPLELPEVIPVSDGFGVFNMLIGVTKEELEVVKDMDDIYVLADRLFQEGYINYGPLDRKSVKYLFLH